MALMKVILPILANVELPSALVACVIVICLTFLIHTTLKRQKPEELLKLLNVFIGAAGLLLGAFVTYFFTEKTTQAKVQTVQARSAAELGSALSAFRAASDAVKTKLSPEDAKWFESMIEMPSASTSHKTPTPNLKGQFPFILKLKSPTPSPSPSE